MQIIILSKKGRKALHFSFAQKSLLIAIVATPILLGVVFYLMSSFSSGLSPSAKATTIGGEVLSQRSDLDRLREKTRNTLDGMALKVGQMQAQLIRLNAVGEHLAKKAHFDAPEFDFDKVPAQGGAGLLDSLVGSFDEGQLMKDINTLDNQMALREKQLELLDHFLINKTLTKKVSPAGLPAKKGWLSSYFGYRADPFTGRKAFHHGVDIAGKEGTSVLAVAAGIVTLAGEKNGYGYLVEIDHGAGYVTRYGHNKSIKVQTGDVVKQDQVIALMGSTGRSTGPHVHFEVIQNGKKVNPKKYLNAKR
jgi:murein DD-endopeptidase MepM/ murein hydrolase activator NlpD